MIKLVVLLVAIFTLNAAAGSKAQTITLNAHNKPLGEVMEEIRKQEGYSFFFFGDEIARTPVSVQVKNASLEEAMKAVLAGSEMEWLLKEETIVIKRHSDRHHTSARKIQQRTIQGKVITPGGSPLEGVTVRVKDLSTIVVTDAGGNYRITVSSENAVLTFSMLGYGRQEVVIGNENRMDIVLRPLAEDLDEVVVVGYGEVARKDLTGSVSSFSPKEEQSTQFATVDGLLQGRMAGVQVSANSAEPGGTMSIRIRGTSSLRNDNEPLYVVDGIIMNSVVEDAPGGFGGTDIQSPQNGLAGLNPQDIESIEVLKDASATALYGSRGANGVVLITTKQGYGDAKVNLHSTTNIGYFAKRVPVLSGLEYAHYRNEREALRGSNPLFVVDDDGNISQYLPASLIADGEIPRSYLPVNWQDEVTQTAFTHNHRLTISGSKDKTRYYMAAGYQKQRGLIQQTGTEQGDFRINLAHEVSNKLSVNAKVVTTFRMNNMTSGTNWSGATTSSMIRRMISAPPLKGFLDDSDRIDEDDEDMSIVQGPNIWLREYDDDSKKFRLLGSFSARYRFSPVFSYELRTGLDFNDDERKRWYGKRVFLGANSNGMAGISEMKRYQYNVDNMLHFRKRFSKMHRVDGTIAVVLDGAHRQASFVKGTDFASEVLRADGITFAGQLYPYEFNRSKQTLLSGLGRFNYTLNNKYLFTASFRADGSSKFAVGNKYSFFPAAAFAWQVGKEKFIKNIKEISDLKFRLSYGRTGSQAISPYQTYSPYEYAAYPGADQDYIGVRPSSLANPELIWETTEQYNAGVDFGLFNDRLTGTVEVYQKVTSNLLQSSFQIPTSTGFSTMAVNMGEMGNKGLEIALNGVLLDKGFTWNLGGNISFNRNKIRHLGLLPGVFGSQEMVAYIGRNISDATIFRMPANIFIEGQPIGLFWGFQSSGVIRDLQDLEHAPSFRGSAPKLGELMFVDQNGDGNIDDQDITVIGNPNPKYTFGINSNMRYKNFSLDLLITGSYGNQIANGTQMWEIPSSQQQSRNIRIENYEKAWRPDAPNTDYTGLDWSFDQASVFTNRNVEDGSFLRLSYVTIGYDVPVRRIPFMQRLHVYATGKNLLLLTKYKGYDPEVNSFAYDARRIGVDWQSYPMVSSFLFGLNVTF